MIARGCFEGLGSALKELSNMRNAFVCVCVCVYEREDDIITTTGRWPVEGHYGLLP